MIVEHILDLQDFLNESLRYSQGINQRTVKKVQEEIQETLMPMLRLKESAYAFVGSAGKKKNYKELSHNINLALDLKTLMKENNLEIEYVNKFITEELKRLKYKCTEENGKVLVNWSHKGELVEVRIQLVENLEWTKYARHSPNLNINESKYVGKYREAIFTAIARVGKKEVISYMDSNESVKEYQRYYFDVDEGLCYITKSFEGKNGTLKTPRLLENSKRLVTDDPKEFVKMLFGESFTPEDTMTLEGCLEAVNSKEFRLAKRKAEVLKKAKQECINLRLTVPEGLM